MLDLEFLNLSLAEIRKLGQNKISDYKIIEKAKHLYFEYKQQLISLENLRAARNQNNLVISKLVKEKNKNKDLDSYKKNGDQLKTEIKKIDKYVSELYAELINNLSYVENIPDPKAPVGSEEADDRIIEVVGSITKGRNISHIKIATDLNLIDWHRTSVLSGARFITYLNKGAKLKRALINFMLDENANNGYQELSTPYLVNKEALYGTGQLPKFHNDLYMTKEGKHYLLPTSEVSLVNMYQNKIFKLSELPLKLTQYSPCFRKEAGAAGKDNRGAIRLHQFDKVEIVQIVTPETSPKALRDMVSHVKKLLIKLEIPFRIIELCTGSLGFAAAQTFDLEVWLPSQNKYREISSCSNCTDFQARRIKLKYKSEKGNEYLHTLNGSSIAVDRLIAAFLETHYSEKNIIHIPKALRPYLGGKEIIE